MGSAPASGAVNGALAVRNAFFWNRRVETSARLLFDARRAELRQGRARSPSLNRYNTCPTSVSGVEKDAHIWGEELKRQTRRFPRLQRSARQFRGDLRTQFRSFC